jgi:hypothetical protein
MPAQVCYQLGKAWYAGRLDLHWRPKSKDEIESIFAQVGLTDGFWSLDDPAEM